MTPSSGTETPFYERYEVAAAAGAFSDAYDIPRFGSLIFRFTRTSVQVLHTEGILVHRDPE